MMAGSVGKHCFVMVTKSDGHQSSYSGTVSTIKNRKGKDVGVLTARACDFPSDEWGCEPGSASYSCTHLGNLPCEETYKCLDGVVSWVNNLQCVYHAVRGPNSNTVARTLLSKCGKGLKIPMLLPGLPQMAPGFRDISDKCTKADDV